MKKMKQRTARQLILRRAAKFKAERAATTLEYINEMKPNERNARWYSACLVHLYRKPLTGRTLAQAVCICRRNLLVGPEVLIAAGFHGIRRNN
jgi:hypothetical protein